MSYVNYIFLDYIIPFNSPSHPFPLINSMSKVFLVYWREKFLQKLVNRGIQQKKHEQILVSEATCGKC